MPTPTPDDIDAAHEQRIADAKAALLAATTREERIEWAREMRELINARSPEMVAKLEHERGLA